MSALRENFLQNCRFSFYNGTSLYMDKIETTQQAYMHLPCCKHSSDRVSVLVDYIHLCCANIHMLLYFHKAKQLCEKPEKNLNV